MMVMSLIPVRMFSLLSGSDAEFLQKFCDLIARLVRSFQKVIHGLLNSWKPNIHAVAGPCVGYGFRWHVVDMC